MKKADKRETFEKAKGRWMKAKGLCSRKTGRRCGYCGRQGVAITSHHITNAAPSRR